MALGGHSRREPGAGGSTLGPPAPPLSLVLVFDRTVSVSRQDASFDWVVTKMTDALGLNMKDDDFLRFGMFGRRLLLTRRFSGHELSGPYRPLPEDVPVADRFGPSPLWDALDTAVTTLAGDTGRRAIIIYTDGRSTGNVLGVRDVIAHARSEHVAVSIITWPFTVMSPGGPVTNLPVNPNHLLASIASATGGTMNVLDLGRKPPLDFELCLMLIFDDLRNPH
jgi:hypothetical protein